MATTFVAQFTPGESYEECRGKCVKAQLYIHQPPRRTSPLYRHRQHKGPHHREQRNVTVAALLQWDRVLFRQRGDAYIVVSAGASVPNLRNLSPACVPVKDCRHLTAATTRQATMCAEEKIPKVDYVHDVRLALDRHAHTLEGVIEVFAVDDPGQTTEDIIEGENELTAHTNPARHEADLLDRGRIRIPFELDTDYENVFQMERLTRRVDRPLPDDSLEIPVQLSDMMYDWSILCLQDQSPRSDSNWPGEIELFDEILEDFLPERLDLDSWIAREMMCAVGSRVTGEYVPPLEFQAWKPWMSYHRPGPIEHQGRKVATIPFLGVASLGRLVWFPRGGIPVPYTEELRAHHASVTENLRRVERSLLTLARRIARLVAVFVIEDYALPEAQSQGRPILDREQIGRAVREILGEAWFKLPLDVDGALRDWSIDEVLKPDDDPSGSPYLHGDETPGWVYPYSEGTDSEEASDDD